MYVRIFTLFREVLRFSKYNVLNFCVRCHCESCFRNLVKNLKRSFWLNTFKYFRKEIDVNGLARF